MPLKHAVLALVVERRGYGYELVQRLEERVGPGWHLNPSAVYPALDQLERGGLVTSAARRGGTRRSPRIVYSATPAGLAALSAWLETPATAPEPVRSDLYLRVAFARRQHRDALASQLLAHERACRRLLTNYPRRCEDVPDASGVALLDAAVVAHMRTEAAWAARASATLAREDG